MSDIPAAREALKEAKKIKDLPQDARNLINKALRLMWRDKAIRRAPGKPSNIGILKRAQIRHLARTTNMTMHQIAMSVGVRNSGRVSEVLNGKHRKKRKNNKWHSPQHRVPAHPSKSPLHGPTRV
jgi:hypothetical protein